MAVPSAPVTFTGHCYCGDVQFSLTLHSPATFSGYCHCDDCQRAHASPVYQFAYVDASAFTLESGSHCIKSYVRDQSLAPELRRWFCTTCGSRVYNTLLPTLEGTVRSQVGIFPALLTDRAAGQHALLRPRYHLHSKEASFPLECLHDRLPRR